MLCALLYMFFNVYTYIKKRCLLGYAFEVISVRHIVRRRGNYYFPFITLFLSSSLYGERRCLGETRVCQTRDRKKRFNKMVTNRLVGR